jgi:phosphoenolpyruvate-protein kinase (PTS system EI component)
MMKTELRKDNMLTLVGEGVSPGLAKGQAFIYIDVLKRESEFYKIDDAQVDEEKARIDKAIDDVRQSLTIDVKRIESQLGKRSADIFRAHETMLLDPSVIEELKRTLEAERTSSWQVQRIER